MVFSWLRRLFTRKNRPLTNGRGSKRRPLSYRPRLEGLEDRLTPATKVWLGATSNLWSVGTNWVGGAAPTTGDDLLFDNNATGNKNNTNDITSTLPSVNSIKILGDNYILNGNGFSLVNGFTSTGALPRINLPLTLTNNPQTFANFGGTAAEFDSNVALGGSALTLNAENGSLLFTATSTITGAGGLTVLGNGTGSVAAVLQGNNTYTGQTDVKSNGEVSVQNNAGLGASGVGNETVVEAGGTLLFGTGAAGGNNLAESLILSGSGVGGSGGTLGALSNGTGNNTVSGPVTLNSVSTGTATIENLTPALTLTVSGAVTFGTANSLHTFTQAANQVVAFTGGITGAGSFIVDGGTTTLGGTASTYSGLTTVGNNPGSLILNAANTLPAGTGIIVLTGGTVDLNGNNQTVASLGGNNGGTITDTGALATLTVANTAPVTFFGLLAGNLALAEAGSNLNPLNLLNSSNTYSGGTTFTSSIVVVPVDGALGASGGGLTFGGGTLETTGTFTTSRPVTLGNAGGTFDIVSGTTLTLSGAITGPGALNAIDGGTLALTNTGNLYAGGTTLNVGATVSIGDDRELGTGGGVTFGLVGFSTVVTTATFITNRTVTLNGVLGGNFNVGTNTTLTLSGLITGAGPLGKFGNGTLVLTDAANNYSGFTGISGGILRVDVDSELGSTAGTLALSTGGTLATTTTFTITRAVTLAGGSGVFDVAPGTTLTLTGQISFAGNLTKVDTGILVLANTANAYTGGTTINAGLLSIGADGALGNTAGGLTFGGGTLVSFGSNVTLLASRTITLTAGGTFDVVPAALLTVAGPITGAGALTKSDTGTLVLASAANNYTGGTVVTGGILRVTADSDLGAATGSVTLTSATLEAAGSFATPRNFVLTAGIIQVDAGLTLAVAGTITGAGGLTDQGSGTLVLQASNGYTGNTTIGGVVSIGADAALGAAGGPVIFAATGTLLTTATFTLGATRTVSIPAGGTFDVTAGTTLTVASQISGAGALTKIDTGTLVLTTANAYAGGTALNGGTLQVGDGTTNGSLGSGSVAIAAAATLQFDTPGTSTVAGPNFANALSGQGTISAIGPNATTGDLTVSGNNAGFTGALNISGGRYTVGAATALGTPSSISVSGTGQLFLNFAGVINAPVALSTLGFSDSSAGNPQLGAVRFGVAGGVLAGPVTVTGTARVGASGTSGTISGNIGGLGTLQIGAGLATPETIAFTGSNTYGATVINANATLQIGNAAAAGTLGSGAVTDNGALAFNRTDTLTVANAISGVGSLTQAGTGTLVLTGANSYGGGTTLAAGTLSVAADGNLGGAGGVTFVAGTFATTATFSTARAFTFTAGGIFDVAAGTALTVGGQITGQGPLSKVAGGTLVLGNALNTYTTGTVLNFGKVSVAADGALGDPGGALNFNGGTLATTATFTTNRGMTLNSDGSTIAVAPGTTLTANGLLGGAGTLTKANTGVLVLGNPGNRYVGTTIDGGTVQVSAEGDLGALAGAATINAATLEVAAGFTSARSYVLGSPASTLQVDEGQIFTVNSALTGAGFTLTGGGVFVPTNAGNSHDGTRVTAGTLQIGADGQLGSTAAILIFNGGTVAATASFTTNRPVTVSAASTLDIAAGTTLTLGGPLGGGGNLNKTNTGNLTLTGHGSAGGTLTFVSGILIVSGSVGAEGVILNGGATLAGTGKVGALTGNNGAFLTPGDTPGTITSGPVTLNPGFIYVADINGAAAAQYDTLDVLGSANLGGATLQLSLAPTLPGTVATGTVFTLVSTSGGVSGTFAGLPDGAIFTQAVGGTTMGFRINYANNAVTLTVLGPPAAASQTVTANAGTPITVTLTGSDPNNPPLPLTFTVTGNPSHGTLSGTAPNLTYTPVAGYFGPDSFQFKANDGAFDSPLGTVTLTVVGAPVASGQSLTTNQGTPVAVTLTGSDPNTPARSLTFTVTAAPAHGTLAGSGASLIYTPAAGYAGPDSFQFKDNNGAFDSPVATVALTVTSVTTPVSPPVSPPASPPAAPVAHTPSVTSSLTAQNNQTLFGLVISPNPADAGAVTNYKITAITNGALFLNDGTTPVANGQFITAAQGNAGLRFTPAANLLNPTSTFTFNIQASLGATNAGLGGSVVAAVITVLPTPQIVYVNNAWTTLTPGTDPDSTGPATAIGYDAFATVQQGIIAVASSGTVQVAPGTYPETVNITRTVSLRGSGSAATVLSGQGTNPGLVIAGAPAANVSGLTLRNYLSPLVASGGTRFLALADVALTGNRFGASINGVNTFVVIGNNSDETFFVNAHALARAGDNSIFYQNVANVTIDGGGGTNRLVVFLNDTSVNQTLWFNSAGISRGPGGFLMFYRASGGSFGGGVVVVLGDGNDTVIVQGQLAGAPTTIYGEGGNDTFNVAVSATSGYTALTLDGGAGNDIVGVFDTSGGAVLRDKGAVIGAGELDAVYASGALSQILYQNIEEFLGGLPLASS